MTTNTQGASWEDSFDEDVEELIDWNYGTIHKQYDRDETCEVLEEDTRERMKKIKAKFRTLLSKEREEGEKAGRKEMYKQLKPFLDPFATLPTDSTEEITNKD